jgi:serine/threonine-protein kinase
MAKSPEKRYQNAAEMSADLRKYRRYAKQEKKKQHVGGDAHHADKSVATGETDGAELFNVASGMRGRILRYSVPLALGVVLTGGLLWWALTPPTADVAPDTTPSAAQSAPQEVTTAAAPPPVMPVAQAAAEEPSKAPIPETPVAIVEPPPVAPVVAPDAASEPEKSETPAVVPAVVNEGRVRLAIAPWGEVYVDNRKVGISPPLNEIKVKPGKHTIEIRNGSFTPYRQSVNLTANDSLRIKHKFE